MEEVKIIYCHDEHKHPIHYTKTVKGVKYFCIDCGAELIVKDGKKKVKHLAHKNTENCGGTGESIFHKHWKENLFKAGMYINIGTKFSYEPVNVEILDVLNEVSLVERYNKQWDIDIIVDVLLITEKGDIVVEINYKNPKDWDKLKPHYDELNLLRVYEVTVGKSINTSLQWFCLNEEELRNQDITNRFKLQKEKERLINEKKKEQKRLKQEASDLERQLFFDKLNDGTYKKLKIFYNFKNIIQKTNNAYILTCLFEKEINKYEQIKLRFNLEKLKYKEDKLYKTFNVKSGIKHINIVIDTTSPDYDHCYDVVAIGKPEIKEYNNRLYAQLCNVN
jgi:hypothetical protein